MKIIFTYQINQKKYNEKIYHIDFPIVFNRRHNNRGYYSFIRRGYIPKEFGFSLYVLENDEEDKIENTILHELAHYITTEIYQDNCQHDTSCWKKHIGD